MIYLASPYSSIDTHLVEERYEQAVATVAQLTAEGIVVYSPIAHYHPMSIKHKVRGDFAFWREINFHMLDLASEVYVLMLPGWAKSVGVMAEISRAEERGIPVAFRKFNHG